MKADRSESLMFVKLHRWRWLKAICFYVHLLYKFFHLDLKLSNFVKFNSKANNGNVRANCGFQSVSTLVGFE